MTSLSGSADRERYRRTSAQYNLRDAHVTCVNSALRRGVSSVSNMRSVVLLPTVAPRGREHRISVGYHYFLSDFPKVKVPRRVPPHLTVGTW